LNFSLKGFSCLSAPELAGLALAPKFLVVYAKKCLDLRIIIEILMVYLIIIIIYLK
jgi:hypothetical protein